MMTKPFLSSHTVSTMTMHCDGQPLSHHDHQEPSRATIAMSILMPKIHIMSSIVSTLVMNHHIAHHVHPVVGIVTNHHDSHHIMITNHDD